MIRFEKLSRGFWVRGRWKTVIDTLDLTLPTGKSLALLGRNGAGKSTLLKIIAGSMQPSTGRVVSDGTISWPIGFGGSFHPDLTGAQNVRFLARVHGVDTDALVDFVQDFSEVGEYFHMPVRHYSSGMRARLNFGVSMGIRFDTYLVDEVTAVGDARFRAKSQTLFRARMQEASAILVSHNTTDLRAFCDAAVVLDDGHLTYYDDLEAAIAHHMVLMGTAPRPPAA